MSIGILGGGLSGVALASFLRQPCEVFEAEDRLGGLCRTFTKDGFSTDIGGHILFSRDPALLDLTTAPLGENVHTRRRENRIAYGGRIIPWPFENGLCALDPAEAKACVDGLLDREETMPPTDFEEWAVDAFGWMMAGKFLIPYTEKVFKLPADKLSCDWCGRVPRPREADMWRSAQGEQTVGNKHQAEFRYPKQGGIEALIDGFAFGAGSLQDERGEPLYSKGIRCHLGAKIDKVEQIELGLPGRLGWDLGQDRYVEGGKLVSTIPLSELVYMLYPVPDSVQCASSMLRWNSVLTVTFGVKAPLPRWSGVTAVYSADPEIPWHRACINQSFAESMAPEGCGAITCEATVPRLETRSFDEAEFLNGLFKVGLLSRDSRIVSTQTHGASYAYPVPTLDCAANRKTVLDYLASIGIHCLGRAGRHEYSNMDQCVAAARDLARELDK